MSSKYQRSGIFQFNELSDEQQAFIRDNYFTENSDLYSTTYVVLQKEAIPLSMFEWLGTRKCRQNPIWDGAFMTSAFGGYFLKVSRDGQTVVVAERYF